LHPSAEFSLAVDCCSHAFAARSDSEAAPRIEGIDWPRFLRLVQFHRVEGFAWKRLLSAKIPETASEPLHVAASEIAARTLLAGAESGRLLDRFKAAGVPLLFLKGVTLGCLAYRHPALKSAVDIDLLIDPLDLQKAARLLRESRYTLVTPRSSATDDALSTWHRRSKESTWASDSTPLQVDLHTRVADNALLIAGIDVHSPRQSVEVAGRLTLPTLGPDELFAYLAVHGAASVWYRLKWASDFAALLGGKDGEEIDRLYARSQELGAGRAAAQALLLADRLFGTLAGNEALRGELLRDRANRLLLNKSLATISREPSEPTERPLGTLPMHWTPFLFHDRWDYRLSEIAGQAGRLRNRLGF
jgi:hypothetical protein